eukprot:scaffold10274_cov129-Cylindrotheca_fusiformis.AAC.3
MGLLILLLVEFESRLMLAMQSVVNLEGHVARVVATPPTRAASPGARDCAVSPSIIVTAN